MVEKLINRCKSKLTLHANYLNSVWIYGIYDSQENLVFMYYGTLKEIVSMSRFRANEKFNPSEYYTYVLIQPCCSRIEAEKNLTYWMDNSELQGKMPAYNVYNSSYNNKRFIQCVENGRFYRTASDIVKIFNVSQSALSNHLRGTSGHRSVKGLHFRFHSGDSPTEIEEYGGYKLQKTDLGYKTVPSDCPINKVGITEFERQQQIALLTGRFGGEIWL